MTSRCKWPRLVLLPTLALLAAWSQHACVAGCGADKIGTTGGECKNNDDCGSGRVCANGTCFDLCLSADDCPMPDQMCEETRCVLNPDAECHSGADCTTPDVCEVLAGARCTGGECVYESVPEGQCCATVEDCPESYSSASVCADRTSTTQCQGSRREATCVDHVCGSAEVPDDSGCAGLAHACPFNYAPVSCTAAQDQPPPSCSLSCTQTSECALGYICDAPTCILPPGAGEVCTGSGQGTCSAGLKCEHGVCCAAAGPACCSVSSDCADGLACDLSVFACHTTCTDFESEQCASPATQYCLDNACVARLADGLPCGGADACLSGFCAMDTSGGGGVCCDQACDDLCLSCLAADTDGVDGVCAPRRAGTVCRDSVGDCDAAEQCDGAAGSCPPDVMHPDTHVCRGSAGLCDLAETCDGAGDACPPDVVRPASYICRPLQGFCDMAEYCDGSSAACPGDAKQPTTLLCRSSAGGCDLPDYCDNVNNHCADARRPASYVCRGSVNSCDPAEYCAGGVDCPANVVTGTLGHQVCDKTSCWCAAGTGVIPCCY